MDAREIERLVETHMLVDLEKAEETIIQGRPTTIILPGDTQGDKLAAIAAAKWIVRKIRHEGCDFMTAFEAYQEVIKGH
jgi:hypothetical protein